MSQLKIFVTEVTNAYQLHFPLVTSTQRNKDKPWMTHRIKQLLKQRQHAYNCGDMTKWRSFRNKIQREIKVSKSVFYKDAIQHLKSNQPGKWQQSNSKIVPFKIQACTNSRCRH